MGNLLNKEDVIFEIFFFFFLFKEQYSYAFTYTQRGRD